MLCCVALPVMSISLPFSFPIFSPLLGLSKGKELKSAMMSGFVSALFTEVGLFEEILNDIQGGLG